MDNVLVYFAFFKIFISIILKTILVLFYILMCREISNAIAPNKPNN